MKSRVKLIVGLGNPGEPYRRTRHNAGARSVEKLAQHFGFSLKANRSFKSILSAGSFEGQPLILAMPQTFMNLSGDAVAALLKKKNVDIGNLLVVYDDVDLPVGTLRLKASGSCGGHNGVASIIERLATKDFARLRLGIGRANECDDLADYVLSPFTKDEEPLVKHMLEESVKAIEAWAILGLTPAMNRFNKKSTGKE